MLQLHHQILKKGHKHTYTYNDFKNPPLPYRYSGSGPTYNPYNAPGAQYSPEYVQTRYYPAGYIVGPNNGVDDGNPEQNQRRRGCCSRLSSLQTNIIMMIVVSTILFAFAGILFYFFGDRRAPPRRCIRCSKLEPYCYDPYRYCKCYTCTAYAD